MRIRLTAGLLAAGLALASAGSSPADDGGSGSFDVSGAAYAFNLLNTGTTQWQSFVLIAPPGTTFLGGATQGEITAPCVPGQPDGQADEIQCAVTVAPGARLLVVATATAPGSCAASFGLTVTAAGGTSGTNVGPLMASPGCAVAVPAAPAPSLVAAPKLRGTAVAGSLLVASPPRWSASATGVAYQWQICATSTCRSIAGANRPSLRLTAAEAGRSVRITATATVSGVSVATESARVTVRAA